jgi:hypothetical protein
MQVVTTHRTSKYKLHGFTPCPACKSFFQLEDGTQTDVAAYFK